MGENVSKSEAMDLLSFGYMAGADVLVDFKWPDGKDIEELNPTDYFERMWSFYEYINLLLDVEPRDSAVLEMENKGELPNIAACSFESAEFDVERSEGSVSLTINLILTIHSAEESSEMKIKLEWGAENTYSELEEMREYADLN